MDESCHGKHHGNLGLWPDGKSMESDCSRRLTRGSCAAVAANMCFYALGTDTGGSDSTGPVFFCGVTGMKPTYGTVSGTG